MVKFQETHVISTVKSQHIASPVLVEGSTETENISNLGDEVCIQQLHLPLVEASSFFKIPLDRGWENVSFLTVGSSCVESTTPVASRAFVAPGYVEGGAAFIEANRAVSQANKETLTKLMELADEANCSTLIACVEKNHPSLSQIVSSYLFLGFAPISSATLSVPNYVLLWREL